MKIELKKRDVTGKKVKTLRQENMIPASIYGPERESMNIYLNPRQFRDAFHKAGYNKLIDAELEGDGDTVSVLIKEVQTHPFKDNIFHVSLYQVDMKKPITADIPIIQEGVSPAVKTNIGILVSMADSVSVRCLPKDLPEKYVIDLSNLKIVGDSIKYSDLNLGEGIEFTSDVDETQNIAYIAQPQKLSVIEEASETEANSEEGADAEKTETPESGEGSTEE